MFLENYTKFIKYYGKDKAAQICGFVTLSLIAGVLEFVGIALIYPFILMIIQPEKIAPTIPILKINIPAGNTTLTALLIGALVLCIFIFKNVFMIVSLYIQNKFVSNWKKDITTKFMEYYIYAPYKEISSTSDSNKLYTLNTLCSQALDGFIFRGLNFLTNTIIIIMILGLLLYKFPMAAGITIIFVLISMTIQNKFFKKRTLLLSKQLGKELSIYNNCVVENIKNLKEIKIYSGEKEFYTNFLNNEITYRNIQTLQGYYSNMPPYIIEILVVTSLLIVSGIIAYQKLDDYSSLLASFAIVVAALFRIAPALNRIQTSIININASREFVKQINQEYEKYNLGEVKIYNSDRTQKIDFNSKILLKNITFSYDDKKNIIKNLSLEINKGDFIGIIGLSGAGKSTLADIILGLLPPQKGEIFVDDIQLTSSNYSMFRNIIGYVPQQVNILNKSFKENVAWGIPVNEIDEHGIEKALEAAQMLEHVMNFKEGINAQAISEQNGLSQGQKQRIAIARALYRDPEILIFDEATSSLDVKVEKEITDMLTNFNKNKTIIAIAHRLSTLKACNKLIYLKDGEIVDIGSFEELSSRHEDFSELVKLSSLK